MYIYITSKARIQDFTQGDAKGKIIQKTVGKMEKISRSR